MALKSAITKAKSLALIPLLGASFLLLSGYITAAEDGRPDLAVSGFWAGWDGRPGESIDFAFSVENIGDGASGSCYYGIYISSGAYWVGTRLADGTVYALEPGESDSISGTAYLPSDIEPGYYYLYAVADDGEYEDDADRSNNVTYQNFEVLSPDITGR